MALQITPNIYVTRDEHQKIRLLSHSVPYQPPMEETVFDARKLADLYLQEASDLLGFSTEAMVHKTFGQEMIDKETVALEFEEQKQVENAVNITYVQKVFQLPIWQSGFSVRIDATNLSVTGAYNAIHYNINIEERTKESEYAPQKMEDPERLCKVLRIDNNKEDLLINGVGELVYRYIPEDREVEEPEALTDTPIDDDRGGGEGEDVSGNDQDEDDNDEAHYAPPIVFNKNEAVTTSTFHLREVPDEIVPDRHYVVTEALFSYPLQNNKRVNWRALIEQQSGSVLYLRAFICCAQGSVFINPTRRGNFNRLSSVIDLNNCIETVQFQGLKLPLPGNVQELTGEFVMLDDTGGFKGSLPKQEYPYNFLFACDTYEFAATNAYYHCDSLFRLMEGMGLCVRSYFDGVKFPVKVDPQVGFVNAFTIPNAKKNGVERFEFGLMDLGLHMGLSADPRLVIHEFSHALLLDHIGSGSFSFAHGTGDGLAAILQDPWSKATDRFLTFPFLKAVDAFYKRRHDRDPQQGWSWGGIHDDKAQKSEEILATTLFRVYLAAGGDSPDNVEKEFASRYIAFLIFKAIRMLRFKGGGPEVFESALTEADTSVGNFEGQPGGVFSKIFRWSFEEQGLIRKIDLSKPGSSLPVDIYIDDRRKGSYLPYQSDYSRCSQIWNRHADDGGTDNQAPNPDVTNYAYLKVFNKGRRAAREIMVNGFQAHIAQPQEWPTDWRPTATSLQILEMLDNNADKVVGPFEWKPQSAGDSLLFTISTDGDISSTELIKSGPVLIKRLIQLDNNIAMRTFA